MWFKSRRKSQGKRILFGGQGHTDFLFFRPIYRWLKQDPRIDVWFTGMNVAGKDKPWEVYQPWEEIPRDRVIREKRAKRFDFDLYLSPQHHIVGDKGRVKVEIFHTTSFRHVSISRDALGFDKLFIYGEYMKSKFIEHKILAPDDSRFELIGMPAIDCLVDGSLDRKQIQSGLNIDPERPTVFYAPAASILSSLYTMGRELISKIGKMNVNFLVKLNERSYNLRTNSVDWKKELREAAETYSNLRVIEDYDCAPYLFCSDILISDASSVPYQFAVLDRPIIFIRMNLQELKRLYPAMDMEPWGQKAGEVVGSVEELEKAIEEAIRNPGRFGEVRRALAKDAFYEPGRATDKAVRKIYELLELDAEGGK